MDDDTVTLNLVMVNINAICNVLFLFYIPIVNAAFTESVEESNAEARLNVLVNTLGHLFQSVYQLIALAATCTHSSLPRLRPRNVLYPEFVCSDFHGRDVFSDLERCEPLFWNLTGKSLESFRRIVIDVGPQMAMFTRRREARRRDNPFKLDTANRIILVFIWLRVYPEIALLSGMFMISPNTVEREIRFLLPMLWMHFRNLVRWPTHEQWMGMRNDWDLFPGAVAVIDGTRHEIQRPQTEPQQHFYSGHCRFHNFSTQLIMDNSGNIVFIQSGFLRHNNDSAQLRMMPRVGNAEELHLPAVYSGRLCISLRISLLDTMETA